jgi:RNA polymerase sigma-70 factor, ECF subfamily
MHATSAHRAHLPMTAPDTAPISLVETRFEDLYRREYPGLVAVATALSGRDGEDLVHDAMVRALVHWKRVQRLERPGGWCHRVLVNLCRSRWRRKLTESRYLARLPPEVPATPGPSAEVIAFWSAVRNLPDRPRLAITLYYAGDRTTAEVASILDVPEGTVRSDLSRARAALARELER